MIALFVLILAIIGLIYITNKLFYYGKIYIRHRSKRGKLICITIIILSIIIGLIYIHDEWILPAGDAFSDYLYSLARDIEEYALKNNGYYPVAGEVDVKTIYPNLSFELTKKRYNIKDDKNFMIAWFSRPAGIIFKWRGVVFVSGSPKPNVSRISEIKFKKLLLQQGIE